MYSNLSLEEKTMMVRQRFKNGKDLHTYLNEKLHYFLPEYKNCRLEFLHQLMQRDGKKKWILRDDVTHKLVPKWPELSGKRCYKNVIECCPDVLRYLPDPHGMEQKLPERDFFWKVVQTLYPNEIEQFIQKTADERRQKQLPFNKKINMVVDKEYLNELLKYDFTSKQIGGKKLSSVLIQRKHIQKKPVDQAQSSNPFQHMQQQQQYFKKYGIDQTSVHTVPEGQGDILLPPQGGDVKLWQNQLNASQKAAFQRGRVLTGASFRHSRFGQLSEINENEFEEFENQDNQIEINN